MDTEFRSVNVVDYHAIQAYKCQERTQTFNPACSSVSTDSSEINYSSFFVSFRGFEPDLPVSASTKFPRTSLQARTMMLENLASELQFLTLSGPELLFRPTGDKAWLRQKFDDIPRYLFRVFTPKSCGATDKSWTVSKDARNASPTSQVDILARVDNGQVARMLNRHLRWWEGDDNLVSWTSSLLFALVYIFHLHANLRDGSSFSDIYLCIIDTTSFSKGVFLRDVDLIRAYGSFDADLRNFEVLRESYYFGEYLSQGALKIEDKCGIVSASAIIDQGLFDLQPKLKEFAKWEPTQKPPWAKPVIRLREELYQKTTEQTTEEVLQAAIDIAQLFGPHWQLPVAANLIASRPCRSEDNATVRAFTAFPFTGPFLLTVL